MSSYPDVRVTNSTPFAAEGNVQYAACSGDSWSTSQLPAGSSISFSRGVCLVTSINATVNGVSADSYTSSGTSYSQYAIISKPGGGFAVTRVVT